MADQSNLRSHRSNESLGHGAPSGNNDPLAELARLIGQNDPFADFGRDPRERRNAGGAEQHEVYAQPRDSGDQHPDGMNLDGRAYSAPAMADPAEYRLGADAQPDGQGAYGRDESEGEREEIYDDPPRLHRRGGLITVMAVVALAVFGTAGAFGYRAMFGSSAPAAPPPVIKADTTPTKVVPAVQVNEQQSNKLIQDRVGTSQPERVVSREEQPIEVREAKPRVVFPPVSAPNTTASVPSSPWPPVPTAAPPTAQASAAVNEPKKVRTVVIRPDQPDSSARPGAPAPGKSASAAPNTSESPFPAPTRSAGPARPAPGSGPLPLSPQNAAAEPAAPQRSVRTASAPNPPAHSAPIVGGSYVQVSSQRSETDAQASFKALQSKYPNVLGDKRVVIRRAELGDKGVYYRAMVGPFAGVEQATELCSSLKAAGGQCVVQKN